MDVKLRPWTLNDLDSLVKHANNYAIARNMMDQFPHPFTPEKGERFIQAVTQKEPYSILAIDLEGEAIGSIGIHRQSDIYGKNAELGYWLAESFWGRGIMTKIIPQMLAYGFETWDLNRIYARPFGSNIASQKVLEKIGFVLEARLEKTFFKNDQYEDELIYAIRRTKNSIE